MSMDWEIHLDFDGLKARVSAALDRAALAGAQEMHALTTPRVPIETARLAGSGDVGLGAPTGAMGPHREHQAYLYYPGPYALYQHQGVYFRRPATYGAVLNHTHGENFYLLHTVISDGAAILKAAEKVIRGAV